MGDPFVDELPIETVVAIHDPADLRGGLVIGKARKSTTPAEGDEVTLRPMLRTAQAAQRVGNGKWTNIVLNQRLR